MREFFLKIAATAVFTTLLLAMFYVISPAYAADTNFIKQAVNPVLQLNRNCSGVVIDTPDFEKDKVFSLTKTYIVTANHCVSGDATPDSAERSGYLTLDIKDGQKVIETQQLVYDVVIRDRSNDLAMIKLRKEGLLLDAATLAHTDPSEGDKVWVVGYPLGHPRTITEGFFGGYESLNPDMSFNEFGNGRAVYKASPAIYGGNSGGGMFINDNGVYKLVGITDAGFSNFPVVGYYNPQGPLNEMIERGLKSEVEAYKVEEDKRSQK